MGVLLIVVLLFVVLSIPAYVIGRRRGVRDAWVAFIPFLGPTIVLLWSIDRSGWMCLLGLLPLVGFVFSIWMLFAIPGHHGRTRWWGAAFLMPLIGMYTYAFTLPQSAPAHGAMATP